MGVYKNEFIYYDGVAGVNKLRLEVLLGDALVDNRVLGLKVKYKRSNMGIKYNQLHKGEGVCVKGGLVGVGYIDINIRNIDINKQRVVGMDTYKRVVGGECLIVGTDGKIIKVGKDIKQLDSDIKRMIKRDRYKESYILVSLMGLYLYTAGLSMVKENKDSMEVNLYKYIIVGKCD